MVMLNLMGGVALLLWGLHMVHSGIIRAFGANLRKTLGIALNNRFKALAAGIGVTALLQSSTATALILTSFAAGGVMSLTPSLATMLGANIGTALIVEALSFDISAAAPLLLVIGLLAFKHSSNTLSHDLGRVAIGLGLMLLSLGMLLHSLEPVEHSGLTQQVFAAITDEPLICMALAALLAWLMHSSVAVILLIMSLASMRLISIEASLALVIGANLGAAFNPLFEGGERGNPASYRLPTGNLINRLSGLALLYPLLSPLAAWLADSGYDPARLIAEFHVLFNLFLALLFLPLLRPLSHLLRRLLPEHKPAEQPGTPIYLDANALQAPPVALACAARETLRMSDLVESMLRIGMVALMSNDRKKAAEVAALDDAVDRLYEAIKLYVIHIMRESLEERDAQRAAEIMSYSINLEHIGDIIDNSLMEIAAKKIRHRLAFSDEGGAELKRMYEHIVANFKLASGALLSGDVAVAHRLLEEKACFREIEFVAGENHLRRLREGRPESLETSSLHLDIMRDLKRIHSHLCAAAYPVLEAAGQPPHPRLTQLNEPARESADAPAMTHDEVAEEMS